MSRPARRHNEPSPLDTIVLTHHQSMTAPQMSAKFGHHVSTYRDAAKRVGVKLKDSRGRKPARPVLVHLTATEAVQRYHETMTVYEMRDTYGFSIRHLWDIAKKLGVKIKPRKTGRPRTSAKVVQMKPVVKKPAKTPPVMKNKPLPAAKPRKESNGKNPDRFKMKKVDYNTMRMLPVGIDNQYFYVAQDASEEEIAKERLRRRERIEAKKAQQLSRF